MKQKLRAPRHPLTDHMLETDDLYQSTHSAAAAGRSLRDDDDDDDIDEDYLTRDEFNLHKIIVAVTMPGKVRWNWSTAVVDF